MKHYRDGGIYTADMGQPPQDIDGGSASMKKPMPKKPENKKPATKLKGNIMGKYAYTASPGETSDDKFEVEKLKKGEAELRESDVPDRKAMRYMKNDSLSEFLNPKTGAGRGRVNPKKAKDYAKGGSVSKRADGIAQRGKTNCKMR